MTLTPGHHQVSNDNGQIVLKTFRDGLAAQAGHDLVIELPNWEGELIIGDDGAPTALTVTIDMAAWVVREGRGGLKPLTDGDRREIAATARKLLRTDQHPRAQFVATGFTPSGDGGDMDGTFTVRGAERPLRLHYAATGPGRFQVRGTVIQSAHGIKPYSAFLGALKVRDAVEIEVDAAVPAAPEAVE